MAMGRHHYTAVLLACITEQLQHRLSVFSPEILEGRAEYFVKWALPNATPNGS